MVLSQPGHASAQWPPVISPLSLSHQRLQGPLDWNVLPPLSPFLAAQFLWDNLWTLQLGQINRGHLTLQPPLKPGARLLLTASQLLGPLLAPFLKGTSAFLPGAWGYCSICPQLLMGLAPSCPLGLSEYVPSSPRSPLPTLVKAWLPVPTLKWLSAAVLSDLANTSHKWSHWLFACLLFILCLLL